MACCGSLLALAPDSRASSSRRASARPAPSVAGPTILWGSLRASGVGDRRYRVRQPGPPAARRGQWRRHRKQRTARALQGYVGGKYTSPYWPGAILSGRGLSHTVGERANWARRGGNARAKTDRNEAPPPADHPLTRCPSRQLQPAIVQGKQLQPIQDAARVHSAYIRRQSPRTLHIR